MEKQLGPLSVALNCAGIANAAPAEEMALEQWQRVLDINLTGVFLSCQAEAKVMLPRKQGSIVNIASMSGVIVNRGLMQAHYNASKAAVIHLSKSLAMEWCDRGVRVNSISPGYTATPMNLRPEMAWQTKQFEAANPDGPDGHRGRVGRAGHLFVQPGGLLLHRRRPGRGRRLRLLVSANTIEA